MDVEEMCAWCMVMEDDEGQQIRGCMLEVFNDIKGDRLCMVHGSDFSSCKFYEDRMKHMEAA